MLPKQAGVIQDGDCLCLDAAGSWRGHLFLSKRWLLSQAPIRITMLITTGKGCVEKCTGVQGGRKTLKKKKKEKS